MEEIIVSYEAQPVMILSCKNRLIVEHHGTQSIPYHLARSRQMAVQMQSHSRRQMADKFILICLVLLLFPVRVQFQVMPVSIPIWS